MGTTKGEYYTKKQLRKAQLAKAFAHPARIAILEFIVRQKECICGDVVNKLSLSQSTVSQHLKELKKTGIIIGEIEGVKTCYCINGKVWIEAMNGFNEMFHNLKNINNCCTEVQIKRKIKNQKRSKK